MENNHELGEFDDLVNRYNKWLGQSKDERYSFSRYLKAFFRGFGSLLDITGSSSKIEFYPWHPIYPRKDLTPQQKDAIILASDVKRVEKILEKELLKGETPITEFKEEKNFIQMIYNYYKHSFSQG